MKNQIEIPASHGKVVAVETDGDITHNSVGRRGDEGNPVLTGAQFDRVVALAEWYKTKPKGAPEEIHCGEPIHYTTSGVRCNGYNIPLATLKKIQRLSQLARKKKARK